MQREHRLQAKGCLDADGFTTLLHNLIPAVWGDDWGTFTEAWPSGTDPKNITTPVITYKIDVLKPGTFGEKTIEIKPRIREQFVVENPQTKANETITIKGQIMDCVMKFFIWEESNGKADALARDFRKLMSTYQGFLMEQGVEDILFRECKDMDAGFYRDTMVGREITYLLRLEELTEMNSGIIEKVTATIQSKMNLADDSYTQNEIHIEIPSRNKGGN